MHTPAGERPRLLSKFRRRRGRKWLVQQEDPDRRRMPPAEGLGSRPDDAEEDSKTGSGSKLGGSMAASSAHIRKVEYIEARLACRRLAGTTGCGSELPTVGRNGGTWMSPPLFLRSRNEVSASHEL